MTEQKYTLAEALEATSQLARELATLLSVAARDMVDEGHVTFPVDVFDSNPSGGEINVTETGHQFARRLIERALFSDEIQIGLIPSSPDSSTTTTGEQTNG